MLPILSWESRYNKEVDEYDWYVSSSEVAILVKSMTSEEDEILYCGCGTSSLAEELFKRNRKFVTSIDSNPRVIQAMTLKYSHLSELQFLELDALKLPSDLESQVHLVVDKALLDYFLCEVKLDKAKQYLAEILRILKPGGRYCMVSHAPPEKRVPLLLSCFNLASSQDVSVGLIPKAKANSSDVEASEGLSNFFVYTLRKQ